MISCQQITYIVLKSSGINTRAAPPRTLVGVLACCHFVGFGDEIVWPLRDYYGKELFWLVHQITENSWKHKPKFPVVNFAFTNSTKRNIIYLTRSKWKKAACRNGRRSSSEQLRGARVDIEGGDQLVCTSKMCRYRGRGEQGRPYVFRGPWAKSTKGPLRLDVCLLSVYTHSFDRHKNNKMGVEKYNKCFLKFP
jgi:hypothetical protein